MHGHSVSTTDCQMSVAMGAWEHMSPGGLSLGLCLDAGQHSFLRNGLLADQGQAFNAGSPGSSLSYNAPHLKFGDDLKIAPLDLGTPSLPMASSLDSKSSLTSFVPGSSLPSSSTSYFQQVLPFPATY